MQWVAMAAVRSTAGIWRKWRNRSRARPCVCNFRLPMPPVDKTMDKLVSLAKRRGFVFQSSEIYGGVGAGWGYGPFGGGLKKNIKERGGRARGHERQGNQGGGGGTPMAPRKWGPVWPRPGV